MPFSHLIAKTSNHMDATFKNQAKNQIQKIP